MKIMQINCVYNKGSTGKIVFDIHTELQKQGIESIVCYGRGEKTLEPNVYKTSGELYSKLNNLRSRFTGLMYGGCYLSTKRLISIIKKEKPDIVHLHCINGYFVNIYSLVSWLKEQKIKTVLTLHAEFMHTANCSHAFECDKWKTGCGNCPRLKEATNSYFFDRTNDSWMKMKRAFEGFGDDLVVVSVSPWLIERAKVSPILENMNHVVVLNGIDTEVFHPYDTSDLREKHNIKENEKVIFHATAGFSSDPGHIKGGYFILELAKRLVNENIKIFVAGQYDESIIPPKNLIFLGRINDQKLLAQYYSMADVTMLTSKKETFSMIVAESLCCGTPVVGFKSGGPETIALPEFSKFVEFGDVDALQNGMLRIIERAHNCTIVSEKAIEKYSKQNMCSEYVVIYKKMMNSL